MTDKITITTTTDPRKVRFPQQPIQWHLPRTNYDRCPRCSAGMAFLGIGRRACMSSGPNDPTLNDKPEQYFGKYNACPPGTVWQSNLTSTAFLNKMMEDKEEAVPLKQTRPYIRKETTK